jgi:hypothetical protein
MHGAGTAMPDPRFPRQHAMTALVTDNIADILHITGAITAVMLAQFLMPRMFLREICKIDIRDEASLFFARHWGLLAFVIGGLMMYAGGHPELRFAVIVAALVEKAGFAAIVFRDIKRPYTCGLRVAAVFDAGCVLIFGVWLLQLA